MSWPTTPDGSNYVFEGDILIPVDPKTGVAQLILRPKGGMGVGIPPIAQGDPGVPPDILTDINFTLLTYDDRANADASWTEIAPNIFKLNLSLPEGEPGTDGVTSIDVESIAGTPLPGSFPVLNSDEDGFEWATQRVAAQLWPATIQNTTAGNNNSTIAVIAVLPGTFDFDWRPRVNGHTVITGTGTNVRVDLMARLNDETNGNIIARCHGIASTERLHFTPAPPPGSADSFNRVAANAGATIFIRTERQSGSDSYTTSASTSLFSVDVLAL